MNEFETACYQDVEKCYQAISDILCVELVCEGERLQVKNLLIHLYREALLEAFHKNVKVGDMLPLYIGHSYDGDIIK